MKAIITIGISASGKSTFAREYVQANPQSVKIDRDDLRFSLRAADNWGEYDFDQVIEKAITKAHETMIRHAGEKGYDVVIAETNLSKKTRARMISLLRASGYNDIQFKEFPINVEEAIARDAARQYSVGEKVIREQYSRFLTYMEEKIDE